MRVAFFGSSLVSSYWNGAATYYRGIIRAMSGRGHQITFFEPNAWGRQQHRDIEDPDWARVIVYDATRDSVMEAVRAAASFDVIVKASGVGVFDELLEQAVLDLKKRSNLIVFWDVDAPATLDRVQSNPDDPFRTLIPRFDAVFTYGGGEPVINAYLALQAQQCTPIYNALDSSTHFPVPSDPRFEGHLGFLGNRLPDREARAEEFFFKPAMRLPALTFLLGGSGWSDKPKPANINYFDHVYTADHNAFNCTPRAVLNITRQSMAAYGYSPATRVFEAAGAAACLITDAWEGVDHFFEPDAEILVAESGDEVAEMTSALTPQSAQRIGRAALRRVLSQHTYRHRAEQLDELLGCTSSRMASAAV